MGAGRETYADTVTVRDAIQSLLTDDLDELFASVAALAAGSGVLVSSNDTTVGYLNGKLTAGEGIDLTEGNDGGNETLAISCEDAGEANKGILETATDAEALAKSAADKALVPSNLAAIFLDEDDMASDSATKVASQQSIKAFVGGYTRGFISGLVPSNDAGDADHDISVSAGKCIDSTNAMSMTLASAIIKKIDAAWAVGTNQGGLDATESVPGTPDASTIYSIFLIKRSDTGVVDVCFSENAPATGPSIDGTPIPVAYDYWRWIGWVVTDGSANIIATNWVGNGSQLSLFFKARAQLASGLTSTTYAAQSTTGLIPSGIQSRACFGGIASVANGLLSLSQDGTNKKVSFSVYTTDNAIGEAYELGASANPGAFCPIISNQIYYKVDASVSLTLYVVAVDFSR